MIWKTLTILVLTCSSLYIHVINDYKRSNLRTTNPMDSIKATLTFKEENLLKDLNLNDEILKNWIIKNKYSEINQYYWYERENYPEIRLYYDGIQFYGLEMSIDDFIDLKKKFKTRGFNIYKTIFSKRYTDFHFWGFTYDEVINKNKELFVIIPDRYQEDKFTDKIFHVNSDNPIPKTLLLWKEKYNTEIIWFDHYQLSIYFNKLPTNFDEFYEEVQKLVEDYRTEEIDENERRKDLKKRLPLLGLDFSDR